MLIWGEVVQKPLLSEKLVSFSRSLAHTFRMLAVNGVFHHDDFTAAA